MSGIVGSSTSHKENTKVNEEETNDELE